MFHRTVYRELSWTVRVVCLYVRDVQDTLAFCIIKWACFVRVIFASKRTERWRIGKARADGILEGSELVEGTESSGQIVCIGLVRMKKWSIERERGTCAAVSKWGGGPGIRFVKATMANVLLLVGFVLLIGTSDCRLGGDSWRERERHMSSCTCGRVSDILMEWVELIG